MSVMVGLNMFDWTSCSSPLGLHVPSQFAQCTLARKGCPGALLPGREGWGGRRLPQIDPRLAGEARNLPRAQARIARMAREPEALMARNMMSDHTDMQDKYCGDCCDIHPIQSQYTKVAAFDCHYKRGGAAFGRATSFVVSFVLGLNTVNIVAVTTIDVLRVSVIGHYVPRH